MCPVAARRILVSLFVPLFVVALLSPGAAAALESGRAYGPSDAEPSSPRQPEAPPEAEPSEPPLPADPDKSADATTSGPPAAEPAAEPDAEAEDAFAFDGHGGGENTIGGFVHIGPTEVRDGEVVVIGGGALIEGTVNGNVTVVSGSAEIRGTVRGEVVGVVSHLKLHERARILGDLTNVGGVLERQGAQVQGQVVNLGWGRILPFGLGPFGVLGSFLLWFTMLELLLVFLCMLVVSALVPERIRAISEETPVRWMVALLTGFGVYFALSVLMVLLCVTVIGIPVWILVWCIFFVFKCISLAGIFHAIGARIGGAWGRTMSLLGAVLLGFLPFAAVRFLPSFAWLIGWFLWFLLQSTAVGLMVLTRAGGRRKTIAAQPPPPMPSLPQPTVSPSV